ncbi:MAG: LPXTG cell wall anchor domain-containing protein, partial [Clostridia bacterium]|nr:LPXTG cell wall anchor domain-containing protein [Clostridia bacterium]
GTAAHKNFNKKKISDTQWRYEAWFADGGAYYIVENVPVGYKVRYENVGAHAGETDRCYNGGTIVNYKVPKTGDDANLTLWTACLLGGMAILGGMIYARRRKADR